jgi:hypothetical protein
MVIATTVLVVLIVAYLVIASFILEGKTRSRQARTCTELDHLSATPSAEQVADAQDKAPAG